MSLDEFFKKLPPGTEIKWGDPVLPIDPLEALQRAKEALDRDPAFRPSRPPVFGPSSPELRTYRLLISYQPPQPSPFPPLRQPPRLNRRQRLLLSLLRRLNRRLSRLSRLKSRFSK